MDTNSNTQQLHTFNKGMVADISDALLGNDQYRMAKNLRYVTDDEENTGELHIIEGARFSIAIDEPIIASTQIRQYGVLITGTLNNWSIQRFENPYWDQNVGDKSFINIEDVTRIFGPCSTELGTNKPSLVTRWEDEDNVKLYIADGVNPLMSMNIMEDEVHTDISFLTAYSSVVFKKPVFCGLISGKLKAGLIEYSYQFYTKHGHQSEISPSTRLIPLYQGNIDLTKTDNVEGYEQGLTTDKGIKIRIDLPDEDIREKQGYTHVRVYRITYVENGQLPTIEMFYDKKIGDSERSIEVNDVGQQALSLLSLEEYNSMTGIHIIPRVIESKNDYLFASNIKDRGSYYYDSIREWEPECESSYRTSGNEVSKEDYFNLDNQYSSTDNVPAFDGDYYGGAGNVSWRFVRTKITAEVNDSDDYIDLNDGITFTNQISGQYIKYNSVEDVVIDGSEYFNTSVGNTTYQNPSVSYFLKSLKRDELYRYGIILYDDMGNASPVKWIADIRVPNANVPGFEPFAKDVDNKLYAYPLGVQFTVNNLPKQVVAYEIVRCGRSMTDIATISQGVVSRPIKRISTEDFTYPLMPTGFLTTDNFWCGMYDYQNDGSSSNKGTAGWSAANYEFEKTESGDGGQITTVKYGTDVKNIYQFVSPEVCYQSDTFQQMVEKQQLTATPIKYVCPKNDSISKTYPPDFRVGDTTWINGTNYKTARENAVNRIAQWINVGNKYINIPVASINNTNTVYIPNNSTTIVYYTDAEQTRAWHGNGDNEHDGFKAFRNIADRYSYIKLYDVRNPNTLERVKVNQSAIATTYKWDEFAESSVVNDETTYNTTYQNKPVSIGGDNFNNWVVGGFYDIPWKDGESDIEWSDDIGAFDDVDSFMGAMTGPGGKCAVISVDNDNDLISKASNVYLSTTLCNIRQSVIPYGGLDDKAKETSSYNSYGNYFDKNTTTSQIFDGDCFLNVFEYVSQHKTYFSQIPDLRTACIIYSIPVESNINLAYTYGYEFSKNRNKANGDITNLQVEADNVNNKFSQYKDLYLYNAVYSANSSTKVSAAEINTEEEEQYDYDYRTHFSNKKDNNEPIDNWTKFMPANYLDVDTRYGAITGLRRFHNQLVFWQEEATGLFSVEERSAISDDNNMPLILGTGGVLSRYDYLATSNGMHKDQFSDAQSDSTLYWWDYNKHELCAHAGGADAVVLSKVKFIQNIFNKAYNSNTLSNNPVLVFDKRFNELVAHVCNDSSIVYSEPLQAFSAAYTVVPNSAVRFADRLYFTKGNKIFEWNQTNNSRVYDLNGHPMTPYLKWVENENATYTKVFDNSEFGGRVYGGDKYELKHLSLKFSTPLKQKSNLDGKFIENREYNFRYIIPRAVDTNGNKPLYGDRLRGKTMQCELESDSNVYDFSLQFIKTKYRISWI